MAMDFAGDYSGHQGKVERTVQFRWKSGRLNQLRNEFNMTKSLNMKFLMLFFACAVSLVILRYNFGIYPDYKYYNTVEEIFNFIAILMIIISPFSIISYFLSKGFSLVMMDSLIRRRYRKMSFIFDLFIWKEIRDECLERYKDEQG